MGSAHVIISVVVDYGNRQYLNEDTIFSPRECIAIILDAAENTPERVAHREMGISLGGYRGKKGAISEKLEMAEKTTQIAKRIRRE